MVIDYCDWSAPGHNRFTGDPVQAIAKYPMPPAVLRDLQAKMRAHRYDDIAVITRDGITGKADYSDLRMMHFGTGKVCRTVSRAKWSERAQERGLVYTSGEFTIIVPTVCGNVALITRKEKPREDPPSDTPPPWNPPGSGDRTSPPQGSDVPQGGGGTGITFRDGWRTDGGTGGQTDSFRGGSGDGPVWGGFGSYAGGGGGGGSTLIRNGGGVTNNNWYIISTPPGPVLPISSSIPEPETWAMLLAGVGVVAFLQARRG